MLTAYGMSSLTGRFRDSVSKGKRPLSSIKKQFKVLLIDLFATWNRDPELLIGIPMSKSSYKTSSRYNALHISQKMIEIVNELVDMKLIEKHTGKGITLSLAFVLSDLWTYGLSVRCGY